MCSAVSEAPSAAPVDPGLCAVSLPAAAIATRNCRYGVIQAPLNPNRRRSALWQRLLWGVGDEPGVETKVYDKSMVKKAVKVRHVQGPAARPGLQQCLPDRRGVARIAGAIPRLHPSGRSVEDAHV